MKRSYLLVLILVFAHAAFAEAQKTEVTPPPKPAAPAADQGWKRPAILAETPEKLLGLRLKDVLTRYGVPDSVLSVRGPEPWQDDVVFRYNEGYEFYWFRDQVWQIRVNETYHGQVAGILPGDPADKLLSLLGTPEFTSEEFLLFRLPDQGYPLKLRAVISGNRIAELYVFRGDF